MSFVRTPSPIASPARIGLSQTKASRAKATEDGQRLEGPTIQMPGGRKAAYTHPIRSPQKGGRASPQSNQEDHVGRIANRHQKANA
jgi:hypothetical protein